MKGGAAEEEMWTGGGSSSTGRDSREIGETLDKKKNGRENG